jgi:hypothetical protein
MNGLTIIEIAQKLGISEKTAEKRLERAGIKPITRKVLYPLDAAERIRDIRMGRPPKK